MLTKWYSFWKSSRDVTFQVGGTPIDQYFLNSMETMTLDKMEKSIDEASSQMSSDEESDISIDSQTPSNTPPTPTRSHNKQEEHPREGLLSKFRRYRNRNAEEEEDDSSPDESMKMIEETIQLPVLRQIFSGFFF